MILVGRKPERILPDQMEKVLKRGFDDARELARNKLMVMYPELRKKPVTAP